jgi:8-oxo-dGTP pyrophosphatase MutT (NUDIX family)
MRTILPPKAKLIPDNAKLVFKGQIFDVYQWPQEMYDGSQATFEMLKRADTVTVIAIKDRKLVVLEESQPSSPHSYYATPGGRHDVESETELDAARREMLEETGMTFKNWRLIDVTQPQAKLDWFVYTFLATDFESQQPPHLDVGEKIEVKLVDRDEALELAKHTRPGYIRADLLEHVKTIDELADLPEYGSAS